MNPFTLLLAYLHSADIRNSRLVKWFIGEPPVATKCSCDGKWDKYLETEHGPKYCSRSSHKEREQYEI